MKHSGNPLQVKYFELLDAGSYPVYDEVPASPEYPYLQIGDNTFTDYTDKSHLGQEVTQTVWIVNRFSGAFGSRVPTNTATNFVLETIRSRPNPITFNDFNVVTTTLDIANFSKERTDTHTYYRMEVRFRHLIEINN